LDEVDDTSIFKTGQTARYRRSLFWLPGSQVSAIAQRFRGVLDMFSSLEVKVLYPT
jgi:hypothetical protein